MTIPPELDIVVDGAPDAGEDAPPPLFSQAAEQSLLGLKSGLMANYGLARRTAAALAAEHKQTNADLISLADSFEAVLGMFEGKAETGPAAELLKAFRVTHELLVHMMEKRGLHQVPILGKRYTEVEYQGRRLAEPWEVVDVSGRGKGAGDKGLKDAVVTRVAQSLWVLVDDSGGVTVVRRAKVVC